MAGGKVLNITVESIQKMILAHFEGDDGGFRAAVEDYIAEERRKNHSVVARELERTLAKSKGASKGRMESLALLGIQGDSLPRDRERGVTLVDVKEAERRLDSLVLKPEIRFAIERIVQECKHRDLLGSYGVRAVRRVLFCGPPGCGKTVAAEALAKALYVPLATVRFDAVVSSYLGETAANLRKVFDFARQRSMALFFDEFDAIGKHRTSEDEHGELKRVVNSFLQMLDAFHSQSIVIAATNHQGLLDPALWRRFDEIIYFSLPERWEIVELLEGGFRQIGIEIAIRHEEVAEKLTGMSHADVERVINDAIKQTVIDGEDRVGRETLEACIDRQRGRLEITSRGDDAPAIKRPPKSGRRKPT